MAIRDYLRGCQLFQGISDDKLSLFVGICQQLAIEKGIVIFREGQPAKFLYIVGKGRVALETRLQRPDGSMTSTTTVASVGPREAFGWSAVVEPHILTLSAKVVEDSDLVFMEGAALREILNGDKDVGYSFMLNIARLLAERLAQTREALVYERGWTL